MAKHVRVKVADIQLDAGPDEKGRDWYVSIELRNNGMPNTWIYPEEARRLAKALLRLAKKPRASHAQRGK